MDREAARLVVEGELEGQAVAPAARREEQEVARRLLEPVQADALVERLLSVAGARLVVDGVAVFFSREAGASGLFVSAEGGVWELVDPAARAAGEEGDGIVVAARARVEGLEAARRERVQREVTGLPSGELASEDGPVGPFQVYGEGPFFVWFAPGNVFAHALPGLPEQYDSRESALRRVWWLNAWFEDERQGAAAELDEVLREAGFVSADREAVARAAAGARGISEGRTAAEARAETEGG